VGWGISKATAQQLFSAGVAAIDVAGAGGTSWSQVEMFRSLSEDQVEIAREFREWGISTFESILNVKTAAPGLKLIASGGLRGGMDCAKCLALGAALAGMARPFLLSAVQSTEQVIQKIHQISRIIQISMFATGCRNLDDFRTRAVLYHEERAI
jgi:isopentenyl-diphosphate delta-isomerase